MPARSSKFGTFPGVFTPSILTILGVILFMRAGYVVGQAGIGGAVAILVICELIVVMTALSISAIATNTTVSGGGAYFLISRVLGPEFGGAIGLALFLAQAVSVPFYVLGFSEALVRTIPEWQPFAPFISYVTAAALFLVNWIGAAWAIRLQYLVMVVLGVSILAILGGALARFDIGHFTANWEPVPASTESFWNVLAIYFPAVTGIMAGVNMSGDLRDPPRSLVRGTFAAIAVGGAIYLLQILFCGGSQSREELIEEPYRTLMANALLGTWYLVAAGVFAATLSSAVGSFMGAPRILQALARDRIYRLLRVFAPSAGESEEPRRALAATMALTIIVLVGASGEHGRDGFNLVASMVTMFFLLTYGIVNVAAFVESLGANPSFRPRFRLFHWSTALAGALGCLVVMLLIDAAAAIVAVVIVTALYYYTGRRVVETTFGDARRGFVYARAARNLLRLQDMPLDPKNWRPNVLVLAGRPEKRLTLVRYGVWFEARRGIASLAQIITGDLTELTERRRAALAALEKFIHDNDLDLFPEVVVASDFDEGLRSVVQAHSLGPVKPNLVILGWPRLPERLLPFAHNLNDIRLLEKSILLVVDRGIPEVEELDRVDVWWRGKENGSLMVILAHLLTQNWEWKEATIRVLRVVENEAGREPARVALDQLVQEARIDAEPSVVVSDKPFGDVLYQFSRDASVIILGFQVPEKDEDFAGFHARTEEMLVGLPTTILVASSGDADLFA